MQPVVYGFVLYVYWFDIDESQRILAVVVAVKEGIYVLIILYSLVTLPAVLLVNLHVSVTWDWKLMYVFAPEKFLLTLLPGQIITEKNRLIYLITILDMYGAVALMDGAVKNTLPVALGIGYGAVTISFVVYICWVLGSLGPRGDEIVRIPAGDGFSADGDGETKGESKDDVIYDPVLGGTEVGAREQEGNEEEGGARRVGGRDVCVEFKHFGACEYGDRCHLLHIA